MLRIDGWRFAGNDATDGATSWKASTRRGAATAANALGPMLENGVLLVLSSEDGQVDVGTVKGNFSFRSRDIAWGAGTMLLGNQVRVDRVAASWQLTSSAEEEDFPAIAQNGDDVWVSYVEFKHGDRSQAVQSFRAEPSSFSFLARPTGGDQVMLLHYSKSRRLWTGPIAASGDGEDILRTAVAVDGKGRVWVFRALNLGGNFDIFARYYSGGRWSPDMRLTFDPGTDPNPVAAVDTTGRVWLAWQGYRNGNLEILASALSGDVFTAETILSVSPASDWDPAIAAAPNGEVAVAWDTYDKGSYEVAFRRLRFEQTVQAEVVTPAAVSAAFEARPSIAY